MNNIELIGQVSLNYKFYKGSDEYSDGDIEDKLLEYAKTRDDLENVISENNEWPIFYHFSEIRKNLLNWYNFAPDSTLLEIGAGPGAMTGLFCEKCKRVVANDLSKKRSAINAYRNKNYSNLEIMISNFSDLKISEKFDYVTLIGVLEYSGFYIDSDTPFLDMLKRAREYLKPNGILFIAIENKFGLKYWAGAREDHTGLFYDGIEGYTKSPQVQTFGKKEIKNLVESAGYSSSYFYYPYPDYKLPVEIYSEDCIPDCNTKMFSAPAYDSDRMMIFDEPLVYSQIINEGLYEEFANSFLIECVN